MNSHTPHLSPRRPQLTRAHIMVLGAAFLLSGCATLIPDPGQPPTRYILTYLTESPQPGSQRSTHPRTIRIDLPTVYSPLDTQRIALTPSSQTIDYIADAEWVNRLPVLLQEALMISCQNRLPDFSTQRTTQGMIPDYAVKVDVRQFHIRQRDETAAVLEYFVQMIRPSDRTTIAQRVIHDFEPLHVFDREHMAKALDILNQRALETIICMIEDYALT